MGLVGILRCRRMRYLAHELRADPGDLARRDILRHYEMTHVRKWFTVEGDLMMDAPAANTTEQLVYMAGGSGTQEDRKENRQRWERWAKDLLSPADRERMKKKYVASGERTRTKVNPTSAETEAALADIQQRYRLYTDGGCDDNGAGGVDGAASWGVHVREATAVASLFAGETAMTTTAVADLWGRVELDEGSEFYHGCPRRTNNTAELCGVIHALLWLLYGPAADNGDTAVLLCDSCYAMDSAEGHITPQRNLAAIMVDYIQLLTACGQITHAPKTMFMILADIRAMLG